MPAPTPTERAAYADAWTGKSGPLNDIDEHANYQRLDSGEFVLILSTTRPASLVDLMRGDRPILSVTMQGDYIRVTLPASEYRAGGITGCLKRHSNMSDEAKAAAGERLRAARGA